MNNIMKPCLRTIIAIILSIGSIHALAYDIAVEYEDGVTIYYSYINGGTELGVAGVKVTDLNKTNIVIPSQVIYMNRARNVTEICSSAFSYFSVVRDGSMGWRAYLAPLSVTIPNTVKIIGDWAFQGSMLFSINIPNSVTSIGADAFEGCTGLTSVHISDLVAWCNISFLGYESNPLYYAHHLYLNGTEITSLTIPNSVTSIGAYAFYGCTGLTSLTIPNSVTSIGAYAFEGCTGLTSLTIPNGVTSIGAYAFEGCTGLTSLTIPNGVTSIGARAFEGCTGLTSLTIPNSVTSIGAYAFKGCTGATSLTIPNGVTSIGARAFEGCTGLTSLTIPNSVTSIGSGAFSYCSGLTSVTIGNSVTSIDKSTFYDCTGLTSLTIPNSLTFIGENAFHNCSSLTTIISFIEDPMLIRIDDGTFLKDVFFNATLYVPKGTIDKYKSASGWNKFVFIEEGVPNGIQTIEMEKPKEKEIYMPNGTRIEKPQKGLNIIKYSDGATKKVIVK